MDYATPNPSALKDEEEVSTPTSKVASIGKAAAEKAKVAAKDAQNKATQLKESATIKAQQFRTYAGDKASTIKDEATQKAQHAKQVAAEKYELGKTKAKDVHTTSEDYVRLHPTKCVLGAFGIGLLIGLLSGRR